ncbi:MAG: hydantoinase/oxoprolinase family protein [Deltaproteobacteria bacterium]|nr:hydantoinase/oxoprolinase family protein [Deltaproteobacteria bacterium]
MSALKLGIDVGGTFTDFVLLNVSDGKMEIGKNLTTPKDPSQGVISGCRKILEKARISFESLRTVIHGTTLVTNTLIERKGAPTGLITTKGFRDILETGNEIRYDLYDLQIEKPKPLVPRRYRIGISERINSSGEVLKSLDLDEVRKAAEYFQKHGITSIAVCLLHAYRNPVHEQQIIRLLNEEFPFFHVSISSHVAPEIKEYERTSTTAANAYVQPIMKRYLRYLESELKRNGFRGGFYVMISSGGITNVAVAEATPIKLCESGPAAGALVAAFYGNCMGLHDLISFDMGGTTAKICLINDGRPTYSREFEAARISRFKKGSGFTFKIPSIEMIEIGAGGGSIGYIDPMGLLKVGPRSAGASPGPACYGFGGDEPTVTDAALILGYLNPDYFLGGEMELNMDRAREVVKRRLADPLNISVEEAAIGINQIVTENMATATRIHIAERGKDPRRYALLAFGGAGPIHAFRIAELLKINTIICPPAAGTASALGLLVTPMALDFAKSYISRLDSINWEHVNQIYREMETEAVCALMESGAKRDEILFERTADMQYAGQFYEIPSRVPAGRLSSKSVSEIKDMFYKSYEKAFGRYMTDAPIRVLTWRLRAHCPVPGLEIKYAQSRMNGRKNEPKGFRHAYFPAARSFIECAVYERYSLKPGTTLCGPVILEERESTTIVGVDSEVSVDERLNLIIRR